jgi:amino acid transporter
MLAALPIFALCYFGWKFWNKTSIVPLWEIDFATGLQELDEMEERDEEKFKPETPFGKMMSMLF